MSSITWWTSVVSHHPSPAPLPARDREKYDNLVVAEKNMKDVVTSAGAGGSLAAK